jgi:hypothetical protein
MKVSRRMGLSTYSLLTSSSHCPSPDARIRISLPCMWMLYLQSVQIIKVVEGEQGVRMGLIEVVLEVPKRPSVLLIHSNDIIVGCDGGVSLHEPL